MEGQIVPHSGTSHPTSQNPPSNVSLSHFTPSPHSSLSLSSVSLSPLSLSSPFFHLTHKATKPKLNRKPNQNNHKNKKLLKKIKRKKAKIITGGVSSTASSSSFPMDTNLLHRTAAPKLRRPSSSVDPARTPNPMDVMLESFLGMFDSSEVALDVAFDRIVESRSYDSEKSDVIQRALKLGQALTEAAKRSARKFNSMHNAVAWPLPADVTIKVFSLMNTQSLCYAAATCSLFRKCAADPMCYACVDLITATPKVDNLVVSTMIQRAGKYLRSFRLGIVPCPSTASKRSARNSLDKLGYSWNDRRSRQVKESHVLTRSCLSPLISGGDVPGAILRQLHLHNIERVDHTSVVATISACPRLIDLEIVGLHVELAQALDAVSASCPLIERIFFESSPTGRDDTLKVSTCDDLVNRCPYISVLSLRGFKLQDSKLRILVKGFRYLKHIDFSLSYAVTGEFLRYGGANLLEVLGLRDCMHLREAEISRLLSSILTGRFKYLRHLDVSNREGLASDIDWYRRISPRFACLGEILKERPGLEVVAEFPAEGSLMEEPMISSSDVSVGFDSLTTISNSLFDTSTSGGVQSSGNGSYNTSSDGNYNSDQSSGNEESPASVDEMHLS